MAFVAFYFPIVKDSFCDAFIEWPKRGETINLVP